MAMAETPAVNTQGREAPAVEVHRGAIDRALATSPTSRRAAGTSARVLRRRSRWLRLLAAASIFIILNATFIADLLLPLGVAIGVVYVAAVLLSPLLRVRHAPLGLATVCSVLTIAGSVLSPPGDAVWVDAVNRVAILAGVWTCGLFLTMRGAAGATRRALGDRNRQFRLLIEASLDAVISMDARGRITEWNPRAAEIFGWAPEEVMGQPLADFIIPARLRSEHEGGLERYLRSGEHAVLNRRIELSATRRDGSEFPVELTILPIEVDGRITFTGFIRDITEREAAQLELERFADELEARQEELEELVSIIAHDLKRPIVSINGLLGLIREDAGDVLDAESIENLELSIAECGRMKSMVSALGALAKAEKAAWTFEEVDLRRVIEACVRQTQAVVEERDARITVDCDDAVIRLSEGHIKECLTNLIENALRYGCPRPGMKVTVTARVSERSLRLTVADHGPGVPVSEQSRIFELFSRGEAGSRSPGTGVGLFSVRRLIQQVGGTVSLESSPGDGARFTLTLPIRV